jgi:hypothetical protein
MPTLSGAAGVRGWEFWPDFVCAKAVKINSDKQKVTIYFMD